MSKANQTTAAGRLLSATATLVLLLSLLGCASKLSGGVNADVRDFAALTDAGETKNVRFVCDYNRVGSETFSKMGDYCKGPRGDYVSYFVPPDIQSTVGYPEHLAQTAHIFRELGRNSQYRYYQYFTGNDTARLERRDFGAVPPTGFALSNGTAVTIGLTKRDILARYYVGAGLALKEVKVKDNATGANLEDYRVTYQISPYAFTREVTAYNSLLLGLPDFIGSTGVLTEEERGSLKKINDMAALYRRTPRVAAGKDAVPADYVFPALGRKNLGRADVAYTSPELINGEGYLNSFLPLYELESVEIFSVLMTLNDEERTELAASFDKERLMKLIEEIEEHPALLTRLSPLGGRVLIRYTHKALKGRYAPETLEGRTISKEVLEELGLGYIYSDMAETITTELLIERFYDMRNLPRVCADEDALVESLARKGYNRETVNTRLLSLKQDKVAACSANEIEMLYHIMSY